MKILQYYIILKQTGSALFHDHRSPSKIMKHISCTATQKKVCQKLASSLR